VLIRQPSLSAEDNAHQFGDEILFEDARIQVFCACEPTGPIQDASGRWIVEAHLCVCSRVPQVRVEAVDVMCEGRGRLGGAVGVKFSPRTTLGICDGNLHAATKRFNTSLHEIFGGRPFASAEARLIAEDGRIIEHCFEVALPADVAAWLVPLAPDAVAKAWDNSRRTRKLPLSPQLRRSLQKCTPRDRDIAASCGGLLQKVGVGDELVYGGRLVQPSIYVFVALSNSGGSLTDVVARAEDARLADALLESVSRRLAVLAENTH